MEVARHGPRPTLLHTLACAGMVTALAFAGRLTIIDGTALSMVWPAAGGAVLWFGRSLPRRWPVDAVALVIVTGLINHVTGAPWRMVPVFGAANLVQTLVVVLLLRHTAGHLWVSGGRAWLHTTGELWSLTVAALVGSLLGAVVGSAGMLLMTDGWTGEDFAAWWGRNCTGTVAVVGLALLSVRPLGHAEAPVSAVRRLRLLVTPVPAWLARLRHRWIEIVALVSFTGAMYWAAFVHYERLPIAFPLMIPTVWAGLRFPALFVHVQSLAVSGLVVVWSVNGIGPFALVGDVHAEAMVSQLFIGLTIIFGLALALGRSERQDLIDSLARAERASSVQAHRLGTLIDQMSDGVTLMSGDGSVLLRNPAGRRILGLLAEHENAMDPSGAYELLTTDLQPIADDDRPFQVAMRTGEPAVADLVIRRTDDTSADQVMQVLVTPFDDVDGARQALVIYRDVTEERVHLRSLESFAAVVAHDLNAPLAVVTGWTEEVVDVLGAGGDAAALAALPMLDRVQRAADTMQHLIRDLLAFSRAGGHDPHCEPVDLTALANTAADLRAEVAVGEPPAIRIEPLPPAMGEPMLVQQVFDNLIGNAVKYTRPGQAAEVTVSGRRAGAWVEVVVRDRGVGVPVESRPHVFEAFFRARATEYQGHGLGLAICQRIIDRYGGTITVQDNPDGVGSAFVFTLPAAPDPSLGRPVSGVRDAALVGRVGLEPTTQGL